MTTVADALRERSLRPFVSTSASLLDQLDFSGFPIAPSVYRLEEPEHVPFHRAYLVANALGFGNPKLKMPNWVYVDCVALQAFVIGVEVDIDAAPAELVRTFGEQDEIDLGRLSALPVSGYTTNPTLEPGAVLDMTLFSLRRSFDDPGTPLLGPLSKALGLLALGLDRVTKVRGVTQYDSGAIWNHAVFADEFFIDTPILNLHSSTSMSFVFSGRPTLPDINALARPVRADPYDFLLNAKDAERKEHMRRERAAGHAFSLVSPYQVRRPDGVVELPVRVHPPTG